MSEKRQVGTLGLSCGERSLAGEKNHSPVCEREQVV